MENRIDLDLLDYNESQQATYNGVPYTGIAVSKDGSEIDSITYELSFVNGFEEGPWRGWYPTGELKYESNRKYGVEDGSYKMYFKNGKINIEANYSEGIRLFFKVYDEQGKLVQEYNGDKLQNGKNIEFFPSGGKKLEEIQEFGIITKRIVWNEQGGLEEEFNIDKDSSSYKRILHQRKIQAINKQIQDEVNYINKHFGPYFQSNGYSFKEGKSTQDRIIFENHCSQLLFQYDIRYSPIFEELFLANVKSGIKAAIGKLVEYYNPGIKFKDLLKSYMGERGDLKMTDIQAYSIIIPKYLNDVIKNCDFSWEDVIDLKR